MAKYEISRTGLNDIENSSFGFFSRETAKNAVIEYGTSVGRETAIMFVFESLVLAFENDEEYKSQLAIQLCQQYARVTLPRHQLRFGDKKPFDVIAFDREEYEIDLIGTNKGRIPDKGEHLPVVVPPLYDTQTGELVEKGSCYWCLIGGVPDVNL